MPQRQGFFIMSVLTRDRFIYYNLFMKQPAKTMIKHLPSFIAVCISLHIFIVFIILFAILGVWEAVLCGVLGVAAIILPYCLMRHVIPVKYNDEIVKYRKTEYRWDNVKITVVAVPWGKGFTYCLVFGDRFMFGAPTHKKLKSGFFVRLTKRNLQTVTKYYNDRLPIVDLSGSSADKLRWNKKLQPIIDDHNKKYFDKVKQYNKID